MTNETEFNLTAPQNKLLSAFLLSNISGSSVILKMYDNYSAANEAQLPILRQFDAYRSIFYETVVNFDPNSSFYNKNLIDDYISNNILSTSYVTPSLPKVSIAGLTGSNMVFDIGSHNDILKTRVNTDLDNLEVYHGLDANNKIKIIVYKNPYSFSYTMNNGKGVVEIPTTGLLHFDEITSVAIQTYHNGNSYTGIPKIWVGTLREGLKSYTIGETSWNTEGSDDTILGLLVQDNLTDINGNNKQSLQVRDVSYLFMNSISNVYINKNNSQTSNYIDASGNILRYQPTTYAPCYIVSLNNAPITAGNPILVYSRTTINGVASYKYFFKYLASTLISYVVDPLTSVLTQKPISSPQYSTWAVVNVNNTKYNGSLPEIYDILKTSSLKTSHLVTSSTSNIVALSVYNGVTFNVELYSISASIDTRTSPRKLTITKFEDVGYSDTNVNMIYIEPQNFSGLSTYYDGTNYEILLTERNKVWRYSSSLSSKLNVNGWYSLNDSIIPWIQSDDTTSERNFRIGHDKNFKIIGSTSYISGLRGFSLLKSTVPSDVYGIVNTDLGFILMKFTKSNTDLLASYVNCKTMRQDLFGSFVTDIELVTETNQILTCGLVTTPMVDYIVSDSEFSAPIRYFIYTPQATSTLPTNLQNKINSLVFYKNYIPHTDHDTLTTQAKTLTNQYNFTAKIASGVLDTDQIYDETILTPEVHVYKSLTSTPYYLQYEHGNKFSFLTDNNLLWYVSFTMKYNRLKFLLQAAELPASPLDTDTLIGEHYITFVPDIDTQLAAVDPLPPPPPPPPPPAGITITGWKVTTFAGTYSQAGSIND